MKRDQRWIPPWEKLVQDEAVVAFTFGRFELIPKQRLLKKGGVRVALGSRAMALLIELVTNAGKVIPPGALIQTVWPGSVIQDNNLRVQIAALRRALGETEQDRFISTVPMKGYVFVALTTSGKQGFDLKAHSVTTMGLGELASLKSQGGIPLPCRTSELVGRASSVAFIKDALPLRRLVTLVGPAGIGKTSIAVAAASELVKYFHDGVWFADFAPLSDPQHVYSAVAVALGIRVLADNPKDAVLAGVRDKSLLLVLDNCEHVVDVVAPFAERLLGEAPGMQIIATSREALRSGGEWVQRVPPLASPGVGDKLTFEEVRKYPAVELFIQRITQSHSDATFGDEDVDTLAWLCRELDGVPLAIELIAARFSLLGLAGLVARMSDRLASIGQGRRSAHPRHRTLRAALDWSYSLLSEDEKRLFRSISVFRAAFSLDAACAVAGPELASEAPFLLAELIAKSLLAVDHRTSAAPYRLLTTTRTYGQELLIGAGEQVAVAERHLDWVRRAMVAAEMALPRTAPDAWRRAHGGYIDDVRAAVSWGRGQDAVRAQLIQLIACASPLWFHMGVLSESLTALRWSVSNRDGVHVDTDVDLRTAFTYAHVSMVLEGPSAETNAQLSRASSLALLPGDAILRMQCSWTHFIRDVIAGNYAASLAACEEFRARAIAASDREAGYVYHRMVSLSEHLMGHQPSALDHAQKALAPMAGVEMRLLHGDPQQSDHRSAGLTHLARILYLRGETRAAVDVAEHAYQEALEADRRQAPVYALSYGVCPVLLWAGRLDMAERYIELLRDATSRNAMPFWSIWPTMYEYVLSLRRAGAAAVEADVEAFGLNPGHKDMLATLSVGYCPPAVLDRAMSGKSEWAKPEILRVAAANRLSAAREMSRAEGLLNESIQLAETQGALAWRLRASLTMATLLVAKGEFAQADVRVRAATTHLEGEHLSCEERRAELFLARGDGWEDFGVALPSASGD